MKVRILLTLLEVSLLPTLPMQAGPGLFPQTCHFNGKPEPCRANAYGIKQDPDNDVEISWKSGRFTSIPYQLDGPLQAGETVLINGEQGSIYRVRSCAAGGVPAHLCTQVTVLKPPGTLYTYTFGN